MTSQSEPVNFYIHVPKTAGTTFKTIIETLYPWQEIFWAKNKKYVGDKIGRLSEADIQKLRIVAGHTPFGMHEYFPFQNFQYFTFLRHPVDRAISHYYYLKRTPNQKFYHYINEQGYSLHQLLEERLFMNFNMQTYWLTGIDKDYFRNGNQDEETINLALHNIDKYFTFIGLNDRFDESLILLKRKLGWSMPYYASKNVTQKRDKQADFSAETIDLIKETNKMDMRLYEYCQSWFEETLAKENEEAFQEELAHLRQLNDRVGKYKLYRLKLIKNALHKFIAENVSGKEKVDVWP